MILSTNDNEAFRSLVCWYINILYRSDRQALTSAFCKILPAGCLNLFLSFEIRFLLFLLPFPSKKTELKVCLFPVFSKQCILVNCFTYQRCICPSQLCMALCTLSLLKSDYSWLTGVKSLTSIQRFFFSV